MTEIDYRERIARYTQPDLTYIPHYDNPRGHGELPISTRVKILLDHSYGELATIIGYSFQYGEVWYNVLPDKGYEPPFTCWYIHPKWFEVIK